MRLFLSALFRLPPLPKIAYRGVKLNLNKRYVEGKTIVWWGFSSCTTAVSILKSEEFLGTTGDTTMFTLQCQSARDIRKHSYFPAKDEVLLIADAQFKVMGCLDQGNLHIVQLEETCPPFPLLQPVPVFISQPTNPTPSGKTGVGKSMLINALANYLVNDTLEQTINDSMQVLTPFCFSYCTDDTFEERIIAMGKSDEYENVNDIGQTWTEKCRSFVFSIGDQLLRLIDTPPLGDTRGFAQDIENFREILTYLFQYEYLNGICILLKLNRERLDIYFQYSVKELLRHLPRSAKENIIFVYTNARSVFFSRGATDKPLSRIFDQLGVEHAVQIPFTEENTFLLDNEAFRCLALYKNGIRLSQEEQQKQIKSWNHSVQECARLLAYITTRPSYIVRNMISLYEVQQILRILTTQARKLLSLSQIYTHITNTQDEQTKVQNVYRKLCKFLQVNAILPLDEDLLKYIQDVIRKKESKKNSGAQNDDTIHHLEKLKSNYANEIELKRTMEDEKRSSNKTDLIQPKDIFPIVTTLYNLPFSGPEIRKQIEELKINQKMTEKQEIFVELLKKVASSKLMLQLKKILSEAHKHA
ncbi:unnamed protein product [Rotaria sp. Silwood2]|nr:unnamed protein product [Rotaria sp. Silwood2]CAF2823331.1 unnamed protein product [Rotaria sp. Silwood2]CAF3247375.1 unnamed protein product [Rotaria sp. Silwood2]CAF4108868.1 unnamed protein product [Rotaria sp. Silwood2]